MHLLRKLKFGLAFVLIASGFGITSPDAGTSPQPGVTGQDHPPGAGTGGAAQSTGYRSAGDRHKVQVSGERLAQEMAGRGGRLIADYGHYQLWDVNSEAAQALGAKREAQLRDEHNVVRLNAEEIDTSRAEVQAARRPVESFSGKRLHLVQFAGPIKPEWFEALKATGVRIVTYIPSNAYLVWGDAASLQRVQRMAAESNFVQWEGVYQDNYKIHPDLSTRLAEHQAREKDPAEANGAELVAIQLVEDGPANAPTLQLIEQLKTDAIRQQDASLGYVNIVVSLPAQAIAQVAARPEVVSIQPYSEPKLHDERQNQIVAGNLTGSSPTPGDWLTYLAGKGFTQAQFTASDFVVDVGDQGIDNATVLPNHPALYVEGDKANASRVIYARKEGVGSGADIRGCDGHGTIDAHIVAGYIAAAFDSGAPHADAAGFRYGKGVCPFVRVGSSTIFSPGYTSPDFEDWQSRAYDDGARISTNSWGADVGGAYNSNAQRFDALVRDAQPASAVIPVAGNQEMVIVFSAGNAGPGSNTTGSPGTAKNVLTVGAAENVHSHSTANGGNNPAGTDGCGTADTGADNANDIIGFSSRGPTDDLRKKPDIVAPGTHVTGGVFQAAGVLPAEGMADACFDPSICALPGKGAPSTNPNNFFPITQQWYSTSSGTSHAAPAVAGAAALVRQRFINQALNPPSPAMTKAVLMNSARYLTGAGANDDRWSNSQGMGEVNLNSFFDIFTDVSLLEDQIASDIFTASGQIRARTGMVANTSKPFHVTLAWTDTFGPTAGNAFVNDLDLEVTVGGHTYRGNVFTGANSAPGGTSDIRNNVESVFVPAGVTGAFSVRVIATNIAGDGVPGVGGALDQDYALVIYNGDVQPQPQAVIEAALQVTNESCTPPNNTADPGETVTVDFTVQNVGTASTSNLMGTLQASANVVNPSGPQNYGTIAPGGTGTRPFTFMAHGTCGETITLTFQLQDGSGPLGTVNFLMTLGVFQPAGTTTMSNTTSITILDNSPAAPYPSNIVISGLTGHRVTKVTAQFHNLSHTLPFDIDVLLVGPQGQTVVLMSDAAGSTNIVGVNLTFDDAAPSFLPVNGQPAVSGTYKPTNSGSAYDVFPPPASEPPHGETLSVFNGTNPNGTWSLYVVDDRSTASGMMAGGWTLNITTEVPVCTCPNTAPSITPSVGLSRRQGTPASNSTIATVNDAQSIPGSVTVTATTVPTGLTVSNIVNTNGTITADIEASCTATLGNRTVVLEVSDGSLTATANLTINVLANTVPVLSYNNPATINQGGFTTVTPATASDNGSIVNFALQSQGTYTGTISVNSSTGVVSISNATPMGSHTVTVRATDNCGLFTDAGFSLQINTAPSITPAVGLSRQQGTANANSIIATVNDAETSPGSLTVFATTVPTGIALSNVVNTNGTITANISALCSATTGNNTVVLQVSDGSLTTNANLTINVIANSAPVLTYNNPAAIAQGGSTTVNPATASDNGGIASFGLQSQGTYTGTISVNSVTGVVSISNAAPIGTHTITVRATDVCGLFTDASFLLTISNTAPTITPAAGLSRQQDTAASNSTIATVNDAETSPGSLTVTAPTVPTGLTVSNIVNTNGTITANIAASCAATTGNRTVVLQVSDGSLTAMANLVINVTVNTAPTLTYNNPASIPAGGSTTVSPATASDNGTITTFALQSQGTYTGTISVNSATGVVSISNAAPIGTHTITIRATDNCSATTDGSFSLPISNTAPSITPSAGLSRRQGTAPSNSTIATVNDGESSPGSLIVTTTSVPADLTISNIVNTNGTITANIAALCPATLGNRTIGLQVSDGSLTAAANLTVNVLANQVPTLTYNNPASIPLGSSTSVTPATVSDNGTLTFAIQSQGTYTGTISVNSSGVVAISNASPAGSHAIIIRATDNCGTIKDAPFTLPVFDPAASGPGTLDPLNVNVAGDGQYVMSAAVQPDGKTIIVGSFTSVLGVTRNNVARLNANGTLDMGFDPNAISGQVNLVAVQPDGKVLLAGQFFDLRPGGVNTPRNGIARLNADGTVDSSFDPNPSPGASVSCLALQPDGKILVGGFFTFIGGQTRNRIARLNTNGTADTFNPNVSTAGSAVASMAVQADGKVLLGGSFTTVGGQTRNRIARVDSTGAVDTFNPSVTTASSSVVSVAVQADGKVLLGGSFTTVGGQTRNRIARVDSTGAVDTFNPNAGSTAGIVLNSIAVQADGKVLLGGNFTSLQPNGAPSPTTRNRIARVNADGTLDTGFDPNASNQVLSVALQADGKVLLGGQFISLQPNGAGASTPRIGFARINNDAATQSLTAPDTSQALWSRGGGGPEVSQVTFELSTNGGGSYTSLGNGTRVGTSANWQLTGLSLPTSGHLRARGLTTNGISNGGFGLIEQVSPYTASAPNAPPSITPAVGLSRPQGSTASNSTIATVNDAETPAGDLIVTATSVPSGLTVSNIANNSGTVTADIATTCAAATGNNTVVLQVSDGAATTNANLVINVTANSGPTFSYNNPVTISYGGSTTVNPATISDNGTIMSFALQSQGTYTGTISVSSAGAVLISNAAPVGTHTITIRATDDCGVFTDASLILTVNRKAVTVTADGKVKIKGASDPALTYVATGLVGSDTLSGALARNPGETPGSRQITQGTVTDANNPNYTITYVPANLIITGPVASNDTVTRIGGSVNSMFPLATLLANDTRVDSSGAIQTNNLSITGVTAGVGNSVSISGAFVSYTPDNAAATAPLTFTYTLTDSVSGATDVGTVTVMTVSLTIVQTGTATYDAGTDTTSITVDFITVPNTALNLEYSTNVTGWVAPTGNPVNSSPTGALEVTFTASGNQTAIWNGRMFFRATTSP